MDEWNLQIDILDVGLGDCSFICAWNDQNNIFKSVLIDTEVELDTKGKQKKCSLKDIFSHIQKKISAKSKEYKKDKYKLDTIIITHFDKKHVDIVDLLLSDNVNMLCLFIASTASHYLSKKEIIKFSEDQKVYYASAIIYLILGGVFDHPDKDNYKYGKILEKIAKEDIFALNDYNDVVKNNLPKKIKKGIEIAESVLEKNKEEFVDDDKACVLIPELKRTLYTERIVSTIIPLSKDEKKEEKREEKLINLIVPAIINLINDTASLSPNPIIVTKGAISTTTIMDVEDKKNMPKGYEDAIAGKLNLNEITITVPGIKRVRKTNPDLGSELLECNNGNNEAPELFIIARAGEIWNGGDKPIEIKKENAKETDEEINPHLSIAILACFKDFQYYLGANLSYKADYAISKVIMNENKIRQLKERELYFPKCIAAFKCGNYGTNTHVKIDEIDGDKSFLSRIKAKAAIISCGWYDDKHPSEKLINELFLADSEPVYYLTGCKSDIDNVLKDTYMGIPRRSRVSGLSGENMLGNITIRIKGSDLKNYDEEGDIRGKFSITYYESTFFNDDEDSKFRLGYINEEISF